MRPFKLFPAIFRAAYCLKLNNDTKQRESMRIFMIVSLMLVSGCASVSHFGKFDAAQGIPSFIQIGTTTREQIFQQLGEPLVHRFTLGVETATYNSESASQIWLVGEYKAAELVIRFKEGIVSEVITEQYGFGEGFFFPINTISNN